MCEKCDESIHNCSNCYWGQITLKMSPDACSECEFDKITGIPSEWTKLGDTYCRCCGRYLGEKKKG